MLNVPGPSAVWQPCAPPATRQLRQPGDPHLLAAHLRPHHARRRNAGGAVVGYVNIREMAGIVEFLSEKMMHHSEPLKMLTNEMSQVNIPSLKDNVQLWMRDHHVKGFYSVLQSQTLSDGARSMMSLSGLGKVKEYKGECPQKEAYRIVFWSTWRPCHGPREG